MADFYDDEPEEDLVPIGVILDGHKKARDEVYLQTYEREKKRTRDLPHAHRAEVEVLNTVVEHGGSALEVCEELGLKGRDFFKPPHGWIFEAAVAVHSRAAIVSFTTIADQLHRKALLDKSGGLFGVEATLFSERLAEQDDALDLVTDGRFTTGLPALRSHVQLVIENSRRRQVIEAGRKMVVDSYMGVDSARVLDEAGRALSSIELGVSAMVIDNVFEVEKLSKTLPALGGVRRVIKTGFADFDKILGGGLIPGDLIILAARPSMGKTQFVLNMMENISIVRREASLLFSLEMDAPSLITRIAGSRSRMNPMRENANRAQIGRLQEALAEVADSPIRIDAAVMLDIAQLRARARAAARKERLSMIAVDYLQLITGADESDENRSNLIGEMTRGLKQLARELDLPVVVLSQLNRGVEMRTDKRPMMSDLRESGNIEQDADVIGFFYREEYYAKDKTPEDKKGIAELNIAKHRNGPTGGVKLRFGRHVNDPSDAPPRFDSLARED